jgi:hypothetical protein
MFWGESNLLEHTSVSDAISEVQSLISENHVRIGAGKRPCSGHALLSQRAVATLDTAL